MLSEKVSGYFEKFNRPKPESKGLDVDVDQLIAERESLMRRKDDFLKDPRYNDGLIALIIREKRGEIGLPYQAMAQRVLRETKALDDFRDTIGEENLIRGLKDGQFATVVNFGKIEELNPDQETQPKKDTKKVGSYNIATGEIKIGREPADHVHVWATLAHGLFLDDIKDLDHELIHYFYDQEVKNKKTDFSQKIVKTKEIILNKIYKFLYESLTSSRNPKRQKALSRIINKWAFFITADAVSRNLDQQISDLTQSLLVREVLAMKGGNVNEKKDLYTTKTIVEHLVKFYGYNEPKDIDKIIRAARIIDRFRALDYSDSDIAKAFAEAQNQEINKTFDLLDARVARLAEDRGLDLEDLDTKVDIDRIQREVERAKAALIAQDEMEKERVALADVIDIYK